jgi:hypothetical protein
MGKNTADANDWIDWATLESRIPYDELPSFHRAFLQLARPDEDWDNAFLRKVQGNVQAVLKQLERNDLAKQQGDKLLVSKTMIPEAFQQYAEQE